MPLSINGVGTKYYGELARALDNSYITTEWLIICYIPLFPLGSYRVRHTGELVDYLFFTSEQYKAWLVALCRRQVRNTYLMLGTAMLIFLPLLIFWGNEIVFRTYAAIVLVITMVFGLIISHRNYYRR